MGVATQTAYSLEPALGIPGDYSDTDNVKDRVTKAVTETIKQGKGLVYFWGSAKKKARLPLLNSLIFTLSADIVTGKTFDGYVGLTAWGAAQQITQISVPFNTSHAQTMLDIKAAFEAITGHGSNVTATISGTTSRVITVNVVNNKTLAITTAFAVNTGGATVSPTLSSMDSLAGISGFNPNLEKDDSGNVQYLANDGVPLVRKGRVWVQPATALLNTDSLFCRFTETAGTDNRERGTFQNTAGTAASEVAFQVSGFDILRDSAAADDINELELLFPSVA